MIWSRRNNPQPHCEKSAASLRIFPAALQATAAVLLTSGTNFHRGVIASIFQLMPTAQ
jgi:hypothetical protein